MWSGHGCQLTDARLAKCARTEKVVRMLIELGMPTICAVMLPRGIARWSTVAAHEIGSQPTPEGRSLRIRTF
jgi:hypothetical protein